MIHQSTHDSMILKLLARWGLQPPLASPGSAFASGAACTLYNTYATVVPQLLKQMVLYCLHLKFIFIGYAYIPASPGKVHVYCLTFYVTAYIT